MDMERKPPAPPPPFPPTDTKQDSVWGRWWAWLLIIVAILYQVGSQSLAPPPAEQAAKQSGSLAMLEIQAKISLGQAANPGIVQQWDMVLNLLDGDQLLPGLIVQAAMPGTGQVSKALANINDLAAETAAESNRIALVRNALQTPDDLSTPEWETLSADLGWFADLLYVIPTPAESPERLALEADCRAVSTTYMGIMSLILLAGAIGLGLLIYLGIAFATKRHGMGLVPPPQATPWLQGFALYLGVMVFGGKLLELVPQAPGWSSVFVYGGSMGIGLGWPLWRGAKIREIGLYRGEGFFREVGYGLMGYAALLPLLGLLVMGFGMVMMVLKQLGVEVTMPTHPVGGMMKEGGVAVRFIMLGLAAVMAPVFEEIMFRGALYGALRRRWRLFLSGLLTGFIFAIVHPQGLLAVPVLMSIGFGFGLLREWRGSLIGGMVAHSVHNGALVIGLWLLF